MLMADINEGFVALINARFFEALLPFILIFTVVFAILQKSKILGKEKDGRPKKNFNAVVAFVMALAVVIPHFSNRYQRYDAVNIIMGVLPNVSIVLVAIIMLMLLIGVWGTNIDIQKSKFGGIVVIVSILIILYIFFTQAGLVHLPRWLWWLRDSATQAAIITLLVFGLIVWFITREDKPKSDDKGFLKVFGDVLKGEDNK